MKFKETKKIHTIGHSNRSLEELVNILKHYKIEVLIDVRNFPRSRRNPQFNRENLQNELSEIGIKYFWMKRLGGLREEGFENYMETEDFEESLVILMDIAEKKSTAFMCAELLWRKCHRRFISSDLAKRGWDVVHIYDEVESESHSDLF